MADSLSVALSANLTLVQSQTQVVITAVITDTSTTPRAWTLKTPLDANHSLYGLPPDSCQIGRWSGAPGSESIAASGSTTLTAPVVFFNESSTPAATADQTNPQQIFQVSAMFTTTDGQAWGPGAGQLPQITVLPVLTAVTDSLSQDTSAATRNSTSPFPGPGTLDFRDNQLSAQLVTGALHIL